MRYILHYTEPGDVVFDGFCGTGMTGVAAQLCGDKSVVESLGVTKDSPEQKYKVEDDGTILEKQVNEDGKNKWVLFSKLGSRRTVLNDLSPSATFITYNYNTPVDVYTFEREAKRILKEVEDECGWMYETLHTDGKTKGRIEYTVWSEIFICPNCTGEVVFLDEALDDETKRVKDAFPCPNCGSELTKKKMDRCYKTTIDPALKVTIRLPKRKASLIVYKVGKDRYEKVPDENDVKIIARIDKLPFPSQFPTDRMMHAPDDVDCWGDKWRAGTASFSHVHHLFMPRALQVLSLLWQKANSYHDRRIKHMLHFFVEQAITGMNVQNRYGPHRYSQSNGAMPLVYYMPSQISEVAPWYVLGGKLKRLYKTFQNIRMFYGSCLLMTGSAARTFCHDDSVDYIFTDPPFGNNIAYAELNFISESFHRNFTNMNPEAIESKGQGKGPTEYRQLMTSCFREAYRVLKPGRWMTVEFSNTKASVWNGIQTALTEAGFIVANVSALDKKQGSFNAVTNPTSVKQDLVISAYKPNGGFEERFQNEASTEKGVWDFVHTHLKYLPVIKKQGGDLVPIPERDPRILFD
ncbi:DNA methylase, partial [bacterium]|nr:DNA methylase [bacterium]